MNAHGRSVSHLFLFHAVDGECMTEHFEKALMLELGGEQKVDDKKADEKADDKKADEKKADEKKQTEPPKVDPAPQNDNDMSLVKEAEERGLRSTGASPETDSGDMDRQYLNDAYKVMELADKERDSVPKAEGTYPDRPKEPVEEKAEHERNVQRLAQRYREENNEDLTAALERIGVKESLDVPNYRQHVSEDRMQGWGRALASFGSVGLKEGSNAIDTATRALGEFRRLTRAFLSPNPMSVPSQMLASAMVGMGGMYDMIDNAGRIAGIRQNTDRSIAMETAKGAQYYKDKDRAVRAANFIMQSFNDQIRDTLGPQGDVTQLNPAQYKRIMEKMGESLRPEIERIRKEYASGRPPTMEDRAIIEGWRYLNTEHRNAIGRGKNAIGDYRSAVTAEGRAVAGLNREYNNQLRAYNNQVKAVDKERKDYDRLISGIDSKEQKELKALGDAYIKERRKLDAATDDDIEWQKGYDESKARNDSIGALLRITLGKNIRGSFKDGDAVLHTLQRAQDEANSNSINVRYSAEQQNTWRKIAEHFGRQVQTVRNMSAEQRRQYASKLASTVRIKESPKAPNVSKEKMLTYTPLMSGRDMQAALKERKDEYVANKLGEWMDRHRFNITWGGDQRKAALFNTVKKVLNNIYQQEYDAYRLMSTDKLSPDELRERRAELKDLYNSVVDMEDRLDKQHRRRTYGNVRTDDGLRLISNAQVNRDKGIKVHFTPHAIGRAMRRLDDPMERNAFLQSALHESGVWRKDPTKKNGYKASLDKLKRFLDMEVENMARDPEAFDAFFRTISKFKWGPKGRAMLKEYRDKVTDMLRFPWDADDTPEGDEMKEEVESIDNMRDSELKGVIDTAQAPTEENPIVVNEHTDEEPKLKTDDTSEQTGVQNGTGQKNNEDDKTSAPPTSEAMESKELIDKFLELMDNQELPYSEKRDRQRELLSAVNKIAETTKDESVKTEINEHLDKMNQMLDFYNRMADFNNRLYSSTSDKEQQETNEDETVDADVQEEPPINVAEQENENRDVTETQDQGLQNILNTIDSLNDVDMLYGLLDSEVRSFDAGSEMKQIIINYLKDRIKDLEKDKEEYFAEGSDVDYESFLAAPHYEQKKQVYDLLNNDKIQSVVGLIDASERSGLPRLIWAIKSYAEDYPEKEELVKNLMRRANERLSFLERGAYWMMTGDVEGYINKINDPDDLKEKLLSLNDTGYLRNRYLRSLHDMVTKRLEELTKGEMQKDMSQNQFKNLAYTQHNIIELHDRLNGKSKEMDDTQLNHIIEWVDNVTSSKDYLAQSLKKKAQKLLEERGSSTGENPKARSEALGSDDTESGDVINTISEGLKTSDNDELKRRIADLERLEQTDPQVASLLKLARERLNANPEPNEGKEGNQNNKSDMSFTANKILKNILKKIESGEDLDEEKQDVEDLKKQFEMYKEEHGRDYELLNELKNLEDMVNKLDRVTSYWVDIQEKNRKNLEEARTTGPNVPELKNTIDDTSIDQSKIKTLSQDPRKVDSNKLLSELPGDAAPVLSEEDRNKRESVINETKNSGFEARAKLDARKFVFNKDNRIGWKYPGEKIRGLLGKSENGLDDIEKKVGNIKSTTPDYEKREKVKEILWNAAKDLKFIKEYFGEPTDLNKTAINNLKTSMDIAYRYLYAHDLDKDLTSDETVSDITKMKEELEQRPMRNDSDESKIKEYNDFIDITKLLEDIGMNLDHPEPRFSAKEEEEKKKAKDTGTGTDAVINDDRTRNTGKKKRPKKQEIDISKISRPDGISRAIDNIQKLNAVKPDEKRMIEEGETYKGEFYRKKDEYRGGHLTDLNNELKAWKDQLYEEYGSHDAFKQLLDGIGKDIGKDLPKNLKVSMKPNSTKSNFISLVQNTQKKKKETGDMNPQNKRVETSEEQGKMPESGKKTPSSKMEQWEEGVLEHIKELGKRDTSKMREKQLKSFITDTLARPIHQEGYDKEFSQKFKDEIEKMISKYGYDFTIDWGSINKPDKFITFKKSAPPSFKDMLLKRFYDTHKDGYFIG